jgi:hypothetical protein
MTLFEKTIPDMSYDIQDPKQHAKESFSNKSEAENIISAISEDNGETICSRSLIMFLHEMSERIYELECDLKTEVRETNDRIYELECEVRNLKENN